MRVKRLWLRLIWETEDASKVHSWWRAKVMVRLESREGLRKVQVAEVGGDDHVVEVGFVAFDAAEEPEVDEVGDDFNFGAVDGLVGEEEVAFELGVRESTGRVRASPGDGQLCHAQGQPGVAVTAGFVHEGPR